MKTGQKLRKARSLYDMSQKLLGELVDLPRDRISAYEAGSRNPKPKQLEEFAKALSMPIEYFTDHNIETIEDVFMILFELEEMYGLSIDLVKTSDSPNDSPEYTFALTTKNRIFSMYMEKWYEKKQELLLGKITQTDYEKWCARLRLSIEEDSQDDLHRRMVKQIEKDKNGNK